MFGFFRKKQTSALRAPLPQMPEPSADEFEKEYAIFRKNNKGNSVQFAARTVRDFVTWQHNSVELQKMQKTGFVVSPVAADIEKAFLFGAATRAYEAFSLTESNLELFFLNVLGMYLGSEIGSLNSETQALLRAKDQYENAAKAGRKFMTAYLINGRQDEYSSQLSNLIEVR